MKLLSISIILTIIVVGVFITGLLSQTTVLTIVGFCAWSPVMVMLGWSLAGALRNYRLVRADGETIRSPNGRPRRARTEPENNPVLN